jgi:thiamine kinase-like enzyme
MNPERALALTGSFARGARLVRPLRATPVTCSYLVERRRERFVMRVDGRVARQLGLDRAAETEVLKHAWTAGIGPQPVALHPGPPAILLTRFVPGEAWSRDHLRNPARLERLARILRRLHDAQLPGPVLDLRRACARYAARIGTAESRALAKSVAHLLSRCESERRHHRLCHNDPVAENIIGWRQTRLIDWEYAGVGDPLFDLAAVAGHHRLPRRAIVAFANAYAGGADAVPWQRLDDYMAVYDIVRRLWTGAVAAAASPVDCS